MNKYEEGGHKCRIMLTQDTQQHTPATVDTITARSHQLALPPVVATAGVGATISLHCGHAHIGTS